MRTDLQRAFIDRVTGSSHAELLVRLEQVLGTSIDFRVCEMPIFVSHEMRRQLENAAVSLTQQCARPTVIAQTLPGIPGHARVPHQSDRPLFAVVDFAIALDADGMLVPRLIELQGFPSLYGYQLLYMQQMQTLYGLEYATPYLSDLTHDSYIALLRECIFGGHDPASVALVEVDPVRQKTRPDFIAMEQMIGLSTINIRDIRREGRTLVHTDQSGHTRILKRIFNRAIIDELDSSDVSIGFSWTDDLDVEWAGHPNWYFLMSKMSMPFLEHPTVPSTRLLSSITEMPERLDQYVLKPLYAFAGKGVVVGPTEADISAIPDGRRHDWILQERVEYARCIPTPYGDNAVEIRIMCVWPERCIEPIPVMSLARTGRGAYMGARYNTEPWTGSSGCLFV